MKPRAGIIIIFIVLPVFLFSFSANTLADKKKTIVSLDLCTDWMLLKYADSSQDIIYSPLLYRYPLDNLQANLPVHDATLEQLLKLNPDLIIGGEFNATMLVKRLKQLGKKVKIMPLPDSLDSIKQYINKFQSIVSTHSLSIQALTVDEYEPTTKTLLMLGANGIGAGTGTLENDIITKSGWKNYLQTPGFSNLDLERIVVEPPDAVIWSKPVSNSLANLFANHPVLNGLIGQQESRVTDSWRWQCPGPWTFDLIQELAAWKKS